MTESERILIHKIAGDYIQGEDKALCGSIQSYRMAMRHKGRNISFSKAVEEWDENIFIPIISELRNNKAISIAIGRNLNEAFFSSLYAIENDGFCFRKETVDKEAMKKAHGIRGLLSHLVLINQPRIRKAI